MNYYRIGIFVFCFCTGGLRLLSAQEKPQEWTLKNCIDYALTQNIQLKKSKIALESSQVDSKSARAKLFPSLSFGSTQQYINTPFPEGNSLDNYVVTGSKGSSKNSYTGNYSLRSSMTLYNGGKLRNNIKSSKLQEQVQQYSVEEEIDNIETSITESFLQILYAQESVKINEETVALSKLQCERGKALLEAGSISQSDYAQLESQYSSDKYQLVLSQTTLESNIQTLKQLLEMDMTETLSISTPILEAHDVLTPLPGKEEVYQSALNFIPSIQSGKLGIDIAKLEHKNAKAGYYPTLDLSASVGTGHISGSDSNFGQQMKNKLNESIGLTLSIPIFSNRENKSAVEKAKLQISEAELEYLNAQKELQKTIEDIYLDATSSQAQYAAAIEQVKASKTSYNLAQEQFNLGMKNTVELLTEKNNFLSAQQEMLQAKYMAILNAQLLRFYQGKEITL
ncbi:TolC family protein [Coprobacter fastidiosus]|jgi:outer membrane protein|uniref:Outer membrane protein n=2 Tax=Coprobacter fastidiosus TaxID=1099853 RepID=A0A495VME4_9BACT|nr:TolC family protein [Coprobacter fastidiosus]MBS6268882.1 TolC family protein [Tannerella sp.]RHO62574.1 TolC family protein [Tannerella sp. AM09-19]ERM90609.1 transporter [Coprobacter fastidiosus NSB1 = JCM 33896]PWM08566.1 MAG: TolC family protein [Coprobacter fastidiosus]RKT50514.1 outer membrane protein [Coprobacter fastidiosus NSB1 = JCM 33896]